MFWFCIFNISFHFIDIVVYISVPFSSLFLRAVITCLMLLCKSPYWTRIKISWYSGWIGFPSSSKSACKVLFFLSKCLRYLQHRRFMFLGNKALNTNMNVALFTMTFKQFCSVFLAFRIAWNQLSMFDWNHYVKFRFN